MIEVTKDKFRKIYFELGGGDAAGWGLDYWNKFFEDDNKNKGMKYLVREPETLEHTRMMIVTDCSTREYRMFFWTEEEEQHFFDSPGE